MRVIAAALMLVPGFVQAAELTCKRNPSLTGKCSMVKGSLGLDREAGGVTLAREDGGRILIVAPAGSNADIATAVMQNWLYQQGKNGSIRTRMLGTYEVCPLPPDGSKPNFTEFACINSGSRFTADKDVR
jgi:hypothetical protein